MRNLKRMASLLLAVVMMMSLFVVPGSAAGTGNDAPWAGGKQGSITVTATGSGGTKISGARFQLEDITAGRYNTYEVKTTGSGGTVTWSGLSSGTYRVTEVGTPSIYVTNTKHEIVVLNAEQEANQNVEFGHTSQGALHIFRFNPETKVGVAGAHYHVYDSNNKEVAGSPLVTGSDGYARIPHLPNGNYTVVEESAPDGYNIEHAARNVTITGGETPVVVSFCGGEMSTVTVVNLDSTDFAPIGGDRWEIIRAEGSTPLYSGTTDNNGMVTFGPLDPGTYIVRETYVKDGYIQEYKSETITIDNTHRNHVVTLYNTPLGSVTVVAYDTTTGQPLPGAKVTLYGDKNQIVAGPTTTDESGRVVFKGIPDGNYTATIVAPDGHVMGVSNVSVSVKGGSDEVVTVTGTELGTLQVRVIDAETGSGLSGATLKVTRMNGELIGTMTTGADGVARMSNLDSGYYIVEQVEVPGGYVKVSMTKQAFVTAGKIAELEFVNRQKPFVVVETMIQGTRTPIPGSTVTLTNSAGQEVRRGNTDANGSVVFEDLTPDTYTAKYTYAPDGFTVEVASQTVVVTTERAGYACLTATKHGAIIISKTDSQTQQPLAGATFQVRNAQGVPVALVTTDVTGTAVTDILEPGTYTIREVYAPDHYVPNTEFRTVRVENNKSVNELFTNTKKAQIVVYAYTSDGEPLANVPYIVYDKTTGQEVAHIITNNSGIATTEELTPGGYIVTETTIPTDYMLVNPTQSHVILYAGEASYVRYVHVPKSCIKMETVDVETGLPVAGATYQVTSADGNFEANFTTDVNGEAYTEQLPVGQYYVKQITAPEGYLLNTTTQTVQVYRDQVNLAKFANKPMSRIVIQSVVAGTNFGLERCSYTVEDSNGKEVFHATTDETGILTTQNLNPGRYTVKEIAAREGYTILQSSRTVDVTLSQSTSVKFEHAAHTSIIVRLVNVDNKAQGLEGAKFRVETLGGEFVTEITTDSAGYAETKVLPAGTYVVHEQTAPEGFLLELNYQWANVGTNGCTVLDFTNRKISGLVIRSVAEEDFAPVAGTRYEIYHENGKLVDTVTADATGLIQINDLLPDVYVIKNVSVPDGWTARTLTQKVTVTKDVPTSVDFFYTSKSSLVINLADAATGDALANGTYRVTKADGTVIGDYKTDANGRIVISGLTAGTYSVQETIAPEGYQMDSAPKSVVVKDNQNTTLNLTNNKLTALVIRSMRENDQTPLAGAKFEVYDNKGTLVGTFTSDETGVINTGILNPGEYTVKETLVPDGFTARTLSQSVTVSVKAESTVTFYHTGKSALVITLQDAATRAPLAGGMFKITRENGDVVAAEAVTDSDGRITLPMSDAGKYVVTEITAPDGYVLDNAAKTVDVRDEQTAYLVVLNNKLTGVVVETLDNDGQTYLPGAKYEVKDANGVVVGTYVADATGIVTLPQLQPGKYTITEITAPEGWTIRTKVQNVTVVKNGDLTVRFFHSREAQVTVNLIDADSKVTLSGAVYRLYKANGDYVAEYRTDNHGQFVIANLAAGQYTLKMTTAPAGYDVDANPYNFTVKDGKTVVLDLSLHTAQSGLRIVNTVKQTGAPIGGNTFRITKYDGTLVGTYTTNDAGLINVDLAPGTYTIYQTFVADGYVKNDGVWNVTMKAGQGNLLEVTNEVESRIVVKIVDAATNKGIYGVKVTIKHQSTLNYVGQFTTDNNGEIVLTDVLAAGKYRVELESVPNGYVTDTVPKSIEVKIGETTEMIWKLTGRQGQVTIVTYAGQDSTAMQIRKNTKLSGAVYQIIDQRGNVVATVTGDYNGEAHSGALPLGTYFIRMITPPAGFITNDTQLTVNVTSQSDNKRVEYFVAAGNHSMKVTVHGQQTAWAGSAMKYSFFVDSVSTSALSNYYVSIKVPTDAMRAVSFYTGAWNMQCYGNLQVKTTQRDWQTIAQGISSSSTVSYDLSTQGLGLASGEYVTDIRLVFPSVHAGFKMTMAPVLYTQVLSGIPTGYQATMRAEVGAQTAQMGSLSGNSYGNLTGGGWMAGQGQFTTYIYGYTNYLPNGLPKTGY